MPRKKEGSEFENMSVDELVKSRKQIKDFLASLEDDYRKAKISEDAYKEAKDKNKKKTEALNKLLAEWGISEEGAPAGGGEAKPAEGAKEAPKEGEAKPGEGKPGEKPAEAKPGEKKEEKPGEPPKEGEAKPGEKPQEAKPAEARPEGEAQAPAEGEKPQEAKEEAKPEESKPEATPEAPATAPAPAGGPASPEQVKMLIEVAEKKIQADMEKTKAEIGTFKETIASIDDRTQKMTESIGELRSSGIQRESTMKDTSVKLESLSEVVTSIKPETFTKELAKRDRKSMEDELKIEKLEMKTKEMSDAMGKIRDLLESIGGLENIAAVNKDIIVKTGEIDKVHKNVDNLSSKVEKIYADLNKRLAEFIVYKSKQDTMDELAKEIMKSIDAITVRLEDFVKREDLKKLNEDMIKLEGRIKEAAEMIGALLPVARMKMPDTIMNLQKEKEAVNAILQSLEEGYMKEKIPGREYRKAKKENMGKLQSLENALQEEWGKFENLVKGAPKIEVTAGKPAGEAKPGEKPDEKGKEEAKKPAEGTKPPESRPGEAKPDEKKEGAEKETGEKKENATEAPESKPAETKPGEQKPAEGEKKPEEKREGTEQKPGETPAEKPGEKKEGEKPDNEKEEPETPESATKENPDEKKEGNDNSVEKIPEKPKKEPGDKANPGTGEKQEKQNEPTKSEEPESKLQGNAKEEKPPDAGPPEDEKAPEKDRLLSDLKESFDKGLISKAAFERTRKMLESL